MKEKQRGPIPTGPKRWPLKLIKNSRTLGLLEFRVSCMASGLPSSEHSQFGKRGLEMGAARSSLWRTKGLYATTFVL